MPTNRPKSSARKSTPDAIKLLKQDHDEVRALFEKFAAAGDLGEQYGEGVGVRAHQAAPSRTRRAAGQRGRRSRRGGGPGPGPRPGDDGRGRG